MGLLTLWEDFGVVTLHVVEHFITTVKVLEASN